MNDKKRGFGCGGCFVVVILFFVIGGAALFSSGPKSPATSDTPSKDAQLGARRAAALEQENEKENELRNEMIHAYSMATREIKSQLKAPSTAEFSSLWDEETKIAPYGYHQWLVSGFVDAQNSFGAMLRQNWNVIMVKSGDDWDAACGELGDAAWGDIPPRIAWPTPPPTAKQIAAAKAAEAKRKDEAAAKTLKWNQEQADAGDEYGELRMGERYLTGDGVEKDAARAREYLQKASAQGNKEATELLKTVKE